MDTNIRVNHEDLKQYVTEIFIGAGLNSRKSQMVAEHLTKANLRGIDSHGVTRVRNYTDRLRSGVVNHDQDVKIVKDSPAAALIDGCNQLGILTATDAMNIAIKKAKDNGIAIVGVKNSNHCGMLADYTQRAAEEDCVSLVTTNAPPNMAPWGGRERYFGTNPISYGIPGYQGKNIIFDMATSVVARGKIKLALKNNEEIPLGWAITKEGKPTTNPEEAMGGVVLPVGGPKGYGLAFYVEVLSGLLTGASFGPYLGRPEDLSTTQDIGHFFFVMRADVFEDIEVFKERMSQLSEDIKKVPLAQGFEKIYLPGEIEANHLIERKENGIPLSKGVLEELQSLGQVYNTKCKLSRV
ncbi:Ldh family oxidoreductase [Tenuibacillus multivorans]|nr:Ldh family oxidoreductase [Tenuibacillus multivorans]GEL78564.1 hypothetical protein TMU01_27990 [Tenuibacillus multivorans]